MTEIVKTDMSQTVNIFLRRDYLNAGDFSLMGTE